FDEFIEVYPRITWLADQVYRLLQWLDKTHSFARRAKHGSKTVLRSAQKIASGAVALARKGGCSAANCGPTPVAAAATEQPVSYYNSGCWTELPCSYLTVTEGMVQLHEFQTSEPAAAPVEVLAG